MDGAGRCTSRMHPISRLQLTTRRTAWVVMFRLNQLTGCMCKDSRSSNRSKQTPRRILTENTSRRFAMQKYLLAMIVGLGLAASAVYFAVARPVAAHTVASLNAAQTGQSSAVFNADG